MASVAASIRRSVSNFLAHPQSSQKLSATAAHSAITSTHQTRGRSLASRIEATPSTRKPAQTSALEKTNKNFNTIPPNLVSRLLTTRVVCILGIVGGSAALVGAFVALSAKVGTLAASQLVGMHAMAFLQPGVAVTGFVVKAAATVTMKVAVPIAVGALPIALQIVGTVALHSLPVLIPIYLAYLSYNKSKEIGETVLTGAKSLVIDMPKMLLKKGCSVASSLFKSVFIINDPEAEESAYIKKTNRESGALAYFEELRDNATPSQKVNYQRAVDKLSGKRIEDRRFSNNSRGLLDVLEEAPAPRARMLTRYQPKAVQHE